MEFSQTIKHALVDLNSNPSALARMTDYSPQYIHSLLNGKKRWNEESMGRVCRALGLEIKIQKVGEQP